MAGDIIKRYETEATETVTALQSVASSQTWVAGWSSGNISNSTDLGDDVLLRFKFVTAGSNNQAGFINIWIIPAASDTGPAYPAVSSGTLGSQGAVTFNTTQQRDACAYFLRQIAVTNTASLTYEASAYLSEAIKDIPENFAIFIAQNATTTTTAGLAASGNTVTRRGQGVGYT